MAAVKWTSKQQDVINTRDHEILVSAAAGSGKTAVLVQRIIERVLDQNQPLSLDRIAVVTFTEAAAAEMKERILKALHEAAYQDPGNEHLQKQICYIHNAKIMTIHRFCLDIIRDYFDQLDLDPGFRVGETGELNLMIQDVMDEMLEEFYAEGENEFLEFIDNFAGSRSDKNIEELILNLYHYANSFPYPEDWFAKCLDNYDLEDGFEDKEWMQYLCDLLHAYLKDMENSMSYALQLCYSEDGPEKYATVIEPELELLKQCLAQQNYFQIGEMITSYHPERMPSVRKNQADEDKISTVKGNRDAFKKQIEKLTEQYFVQTKEEMFAQALHLQKNLQVLIHLCEKFSQKYQEAKREKGLIDFSDMEHMALSVLVKKDENGQICRTEAARELSLQYDEIMIDEYQDSNQVQETILRSISKDTDGQPNVFMVGDVKQSIYKFRLASPELFMDKYDRYPLLQDAGNEKKIKIVLDQNFRSRKEVLDAVNFLFYRIMKKNIGGILYDDSHALHLGASYDDVETQDQTAEIMLVETGKEDTTEDTAQDVSVTDTNSLANATAMEMEAYACGKRILELTDPEHGFLVKDKESGTMRVAQYRDIAILFRSHTVQGKLYERVFASMGIPAYCETDTGYFDKTEVITVLALLKVIENPLQDIDFVTVLKAPFFGVTDTELAMIAAKVRGKLWMYQKVCRYAKMDLESDHEKSLQQKLQKILGKIEDYRQRASYTPIPDFIQELLDDTGYYHYVLAMPAGVKRAGNLDLLIQKAIDYQNSSYYGLFRFVKYIEMIQKVEMDFGEMKLNNENENAVRLMSIHKSKGLEFPVVIVAGMNRQFNFQDTRQSVVMEQELGIGLDYKNPETREQSTPLIKNAIKEKITLDCVGEELRVLYVAMTRAKEKLILSGNVKSIDDYLKKVPAYGESGANFSQIAKTRCYMDWVIGAFQSKLNPPYHLTKVTIEDLMQYAVGAEVERNRQYEDLKNWKQTLHTDEQITEQIDAQMQSVYPYAKDLGLHAKYSVSEIKQKHMEEEQEENQMFAFPKKAPVPSFMEEENKTQNHTLSGAALGTLYHSVFEHLDFTALDQVLHSGKSVTDVLSSLAEMKYISMDALDQIDPKVFETFASTQLFTRMQKANDEDKLYRERQFVVGIPASEVDPGTESRELVLIQGIIDAYFVEDGQIVLVDYKTDQVKTPEELLERYTIQFDLYARALEQMTGMKVKERILYSTCLGQEVTVE